MQKTLDTLKQAVSNAAKLALDYQNRIDELKVEAKDPGDFVTEADIAVQKQIVDEINKSIPNALFLVEEKMEGVDPNTFIIEPHEKTPEVIDKIENQIMEHIDNGGTVIIIDPLDGTSNFKEGGEDFGICIAAIANGFEIGVISTPRFGETFVGIIGDDMKAYCNDKEIKVKVPNDLNSALIEYSRNHHPTDELKHLGSKLTAEIINNAKLRAYGTGVMGYVRLAKGTIHGVIQPTTDWVQYAGYVIARAAGAKVTDFDENSYGVTSKNIIAAGDGVYSDLLELLP